MTSTGEQNLGNSGKVGRHIHEYARSAFLKWRGKKYGPPSPAEWEEFLDFLLLTRGRAAAFSLVDRLQTYLNDKWGSEVVDAAMYAVRRRRCAPVFSSRTEWDRAEVAIASLPNEWRDPFHKCLIRSRDMSRMHSTKDVVYSAATLRGTAYNLSAWYAWCHASGRPFEPSAIGFENWALEMQGQGRTPATIAGRLRMIMMGLKIVFPKANFDGAAWVASDWSDAARLIAPPTKHSAGVVPATDIFCFGQQMIAGLDVGSLGRITAAGGYRDGLLLMIAAALPQRARALSHLDSATTFRLLDWPLIRVDLPGRLLKRRRSNPIPRGYHATLDNSVLWEACDTYLQDYRPAFDGGTHFWPSLRRRGKSLDSQRLSEIVADATEKHLGTRVSLHRVRDAVATEVCEHVPSGGQIASRLLDHSDPRIVGRHYDHSTGVVFARELSSLLSKGTQKRPSLLD